MRLFNVFPRRQLNSFKLNTVEIKFHGEINKRLSTVALTPRCRLNGYYPVVSTGRIQTDRVRGFEYLTSWVVRLRGEKTVAS